ncbi:MAG: hypothetical protein COV29_01340 [Candidatus Yanofskybacteria bacterium CG10_big_fil_rev_8_21_14_0_10_36_16]|uniref:DUF4012 domain-containing protein n=1 Tax=Candidatus Yanofskybacteria bacterium CG10_big_fil_rev_8_21_14_0_10_36_16 TaxID=1975096 RepID=A0A2J0Q890_9BACT|nr:MAG: hypothetical protein COV29_01340 [Candidatus Yanofskybacteria bacterium CG10_big_fil_rev_8_21_14_0_10_36_16]
MPQRGDIWNGMFDIRTDNESDDFGFGYIPQTLDLKNDNSTKATVVSSEPSILLWLESKTPKDVALREIEQVAKEPLDIKKELEKIGGVVYEPTTNNFLKYHKRKAILSMRLGVDSGGLDIDNIAADILGDDPKSYISRKSIALEYDRKKREELEAILSSAISSSDSKYQSNHAVASGEISFWINKYSSNALNNFPRAELVVQNNNTFEPKFRTEPQSVSKWKAFLTEKEFSLPSTRSFFSKFGRLKRLPKIRAKKILNILGSVVGAAFLAYGIFFIAGGGFNAKSNVLQNGSHALDNFKEAQSSLEKMDFDSAADSFALAYDDFYKASKKLDEIGFSFISFIADLPFLDKLFSKSTDKIEAVNNLIGVGKNMSQAGEALSLSVGGIYRMAAPMLLGGEPKTENSLTIHDALDDFKDVIVFASERISKSSQLMAGINLEALPEENRDAFSDFNEKMPILVEVVNQALAYSEFLAEVIGDDGHRTYLILFQNNSELRATGGFPGSYALLTFDNGSLVKIFVDDIYNPDGQIKDKFIPPIPLQHISYKLTSRDANWFADFPTSARKVSEYFEKGSGIRPDGIFTFSPDLLGQMLEITGPVEVPQYDVVLDSENFLAQIQAEIEYGDNREQPKTILSDFQPIFMEKLNSLPSERWPEIFEIMMNGVHQKKIMAYFDNPELQQFAINNALGGQLKDFDYDFLSVVFSNIKGSKTDVVTDNFVNLTTVIGKENVDHSLSINRVHNGGDNDLRFYNLQNPAYVRVYVPAGSVLHEISGQDIVNFKPLNNYEAEGYKRDPDLAAIENSMFSPFPGVDVSRETGMTVFGFWMITNPKSSSKVTLKYSVPFKNEIKEDYSLLWQKQSGTIGDKNKINSTFRTKDGKSIVSAEPEMRSVQDYLIYDGDLLIDNEFKFKLK